ncbi:MAG: MFS transporter [Steroidobacteraceae bacterium]|jgi:PAT family beta-lactamase induction signal transducer AmpG|nr:MFS transporter [Steroidobacteraceae bacterium]
MEGRPDLTLSGNRGRRTLLLCLLYFCQGFPWGFATIALLATLSEAGHGKADTATVVALAILPWTFKFIWGPLIDSFRLPSLGVRRPWIVVAQLCMALTLLAAVTSGSMNNSSTLMYLAWVFFIHNCFASLQDVATDALAVDLLKDNERGRVNGFMWGSKLFGIAVGGAGMAQVIALTSLQVAVLLQAVMVLTVTGLVVAWRERPGERRFPWSSGAAQASIPRSNFGMLITVQDLRRALSHRTTATLVVIASMYGMAEGLYDPLVVELFVQELGWSAERLATAMGTWGVLGELSGALLGGYLCDKYGRRRMAAVGFGLMAVILVTFGHTLQAWQGPGYPHGLLLPAFKGAVAFATALFMRVSWTRAAATQFTVYMSMGNVGYALGAKLNGWLELTGASLVTTDYFIVAGLLPILPLLLLFGLDPDSVVKRKLEDERARLAASPV